ncbi:MAG: hypothetical protein J7576_03965 [Siphonobacter aquaeclarae]|nr:hypothetical protein [Siphonobacter aquaeclarae]
MKRLVLFLAILPVLASCKKDSDKQLYDRVSGEGLVGNWQLFEEGSSPGAGYYITKIPANPAQMLWFRENGTWESNIRNKPSSGQYSYTDSTLSFQNGTVRYKISGDTLTIHPPCYEGCHSAYVRVR